MIFRLGANLVADGPSAGGNARPTRRDRESTPASIPHFAPHPGINFSRLPVPGDAAGLVFVIGSVLVILLGLPALRPFLVGAVAIGLVLAWLFVMRGNRADS